MTVEERAKQLAFIQGGISDYGKKVIEKCCVKIATEQKNIDIEKAWKWIQENVPLISVKTIEDQKQFIQAMGGKI